MNRYLDEAAISPAKWGTEEGAYLRYDEHAKREWWHLTYEKIGSDGIIIKCNYEDQDHPWYRLDESGNLRANATKGQATVLKALIRVDDPNTNEEIDCDVVWPCANDPISS